MEYNIPVSKKDYYKAILMVLNFNLNLFSIDSLGDCQYPSRGKGIPLVPYFSLALNSAGS